MLHLLGHLIVLLLLRLSLLLRDSSHGSAAHLHACADRGLGGGRGHHLLLGGLLAEGGPGGAARHHRGVQHLLELLRLGLPAH